MSEKDEDLIPKETAEALVSWLEAFPAMPLQERLGELIDQRRKLDSEIRFLQNQLIRYRQYLQDLAEPGNEVTAPQTGPSQLAIAASGNTAVHVGATGAAQPEYPPKRVAVHRLLAENAFKEWKLGELREELIRRGWLADDERARHALQMLMLNMAKRGEIDKPRTGVYRAMVTVPRPDPTDPAEGLPPEDDEDG
ncbi:MAG: hypothetical protein ACJ752_10645 [Gaiellaceae bacterium]